MMVSNKPDLPCWLSAKEKYIANALLSNGFYHRINHPSESDEDDELCYMNKVYGCKVGFPGVENYISVVINGCELCLYLGDSVSATEAEITFKRVKATVGKYWKLWEFDQALVRNKQLALF